MSSHAPGLGTREKKHNAFQLYVTVPSMCAAPLASKISYAEGTVLPLAISTAAAGLYLPGLLGLPLPSATLQSDSDRRKHTLLVWGAASSVGSTTVQLALSSGVEVFATASKRNFDFVKSLGVDNVFDYSEPDVVKNIVTALKDRQTKLVGVYDAIGLNDTVRKSAEILKAVEGKGLVASVLDPPGDLPDGIAAKSCMSLVLLRVEAYLSGLVIALAIFYEHPEIGKAVWKNFVPEALETGRLKTKPDPVVVGKGLDKVQDGFDKLKAGVSAKKVVVEL